MFMTLNSHIISLRPGAYIKEGTSEFNAGQEKDQNPTQGERERGVG